MGEARPPTAAEPTPKRRPTFVTDTGHHIGHGQQLAAHDTVRRRQAVWVDVSDAEDRYTRQQDRRANLGQVKKARRAAAGNTERPIHRCIQSPGLKRTPGKLLPTGREFKKPHGRPGWRVLDLLFMPNGDYVPRGCEATFHTTKGLRVVRTAAV